MAIISSFYLCRSAVGEKGRLLIRSESYSLTGSDIVKLRQPTDFLILEALHAYGRNVAPNLAQITGKSRKNVNNRLPVLDDYGLVRKIGPAERSGLYEVTDRGRIALRCRDEYDSTPDFEALIERRIETENATEAGEALVRGGEPADEETGE